MGYFENKVAIVTGSGQGIGQGIALMLASKGAKLVVVDLDNDKIVDTVLQLEKKGAEALGVKSDVSKGADVSSMITSVLNKFNGIDILVNNAGVSVVSSTIELSEERWDAGIDINLKSAFICSKAVAPIMCNQGGGKILNISSIAGIDAFPERAAYCSAKAGLIQLTKVLAIEWAQFNINVNAIAPGITKTSLIKDMINSGKYDEHILKNRIPMKRLASVSDIAHAALFFLSKNANYITGITVPVDGGWTAYGYL